MDSFEVELKAARIKYEGKTVIETATGDKYIILTVGFNNMTNGEKVTPYITVFLDPIYHRPMETIPLAYIQKYFSMETPPDKTQ